MSIVAEVWTAVGCLLLYIGAFHQALADLASVGALYRMDNRSTRQKGYSKASAAWRTRDYWTALKHALTAFLKPASSTKELVEASKDLTVRPPEAEIQSYARRSVGWLLVSSGALSVFIGSLIALGGTPAMVLAVAGVALLAGTYGYNLHLERSLEKQYRTRASGTPEASDDVLEEDS